MRSPKALLFLLGLLFVPATIFGQALLSGPEVDTAAVIRRGDHVEHVVGIQSEADAAWGEVTAPPADDSHKWFITVLTMKNCGPCKQLKADWQTSQYLKAFAIPGDQKNSWAHINFYDAEDETHSWWQKNIKITGYPTVLIQPPRSKQYGDPSTVVFQKTGYNGKPEELAAKMSAGMKTYVAKLAQHRSTFAIQKPTAPRSGGFRSVEFCEHGGDTRSDPITGTWGQSPFQGPPPFNVPNPNTPSPIGPPPLVIPDAINPDAQPTPAPVQPEKELPSVLKKPDSLCVVIDQELLSSSEEKRAGIRQLLAVLRTKYPQAEPRVISPEQAKLDFPNLDTSKPQVILTSGGKLLTQIPQAILDELLKDQPELQTAAKLLAALGAVVPLAQWGLVGLAGFVVFRAWRKQKQTPVAPVDPNAPTPADPELKFGEGKLLKMIEDAVAKALNKQ